MKKFLLFTMVAICCTILAQANHLQPTLLVTAKLNGAQEVPAITTNALGVAGLTINSTQDTVCVNISLTGLSGALGGIHIHEGAAGTNGPVVIDLTPFIVGNRIIAQLTGANASAAIIKKLISGAFYLNAHTMMNPNGEIRGQLTLETDFSFAINLSGAQQVPAVATTAYGVGVFNLSKDMSSIKYNVILQGLSGTAVAAHLHFGAAGSNGAVAQDLTPNINGNVISGTILNPSAMLMDSLMKSKIYLNVHTAANPNGEIRSQLMTKSKYLYFDATINGAQEVPAVATMAMGAATLKMTTAYDTLWYDIAATGVSAAIMGAHIHTGAAGANGAVVYDLTPNITGNRITGMITGNTLTNANFKKFMQGEMYINMHTMANPNGEIRGQIIRLIREGYSVSLDGMQEVPMVTTTATGAGIVTINREQTNAHVMIVASGLTIGGAHFHKGIQGQNGPVIYDLTPLFANNGIFTYWKSTDAAPFTPANAKQFRNDSIYVNLHTMANPNGEIRGQAERGLSCYSTVGTQNVAQNIALNIYPNPTNGILNINMPAQQQISLVIIDALGKVVYNNIYAKQGENATQTIDVCQLPNGIYTIKANGNRTNYVAKLIKK